MYAGNSQTNIMMMIFIKDRLFLLRSIAVQCSLRVFPYRICTTAKRKKDNAITIINKTK